MALTGRNRIVWSGLDAFGAQLRQSPTALVRDALNLAQEAVDGARADMVYPGDLGDRITTTVGTAGPFAVKAVITNPHPLANIFEKGTEARHYITKKHGVTHLTGKMPKGNVFIPAVMRRRREFQERITALIESHGFTVTG
jgi:hypothetical protein